MARSPGAMLQRTRHRYRTERYVPFSITFTDPQVVSIGKAEEDGAVSGTADFTDQGRARVEARNEGALTLYAAAPDGVLIGADLVAPAGEHLGHLLAWAIQQKMTATQLLRNAVLSPDHRGRAETGAAHGVCRNPDSGTADHDSGSPSGA